MHLNGVQLIIKICIIISMSSKIGLTIGDKCGKYGFNCLNKRYYQTCGGCSKINPLPRKIFVCPPNSMCSEECPNPCPSPCPPPCPEKSQLEMIAQAKQSQEDREISQILTTEMTKPPRVPCKGRPRMEQSSLMTNKNFEPFRQMGPMNTYSPKKRIYQPKATTINIKTHKKKVMSRENIKNNIVRVRSIADLFKKASSDKKEKPAEDKGEKKENADEKEKHTAEAKHANNFAIGEGDAQSDFSTKEKFSTDNDEAKLKNDEVKSFMTESAVDDDSAAKKASENEHFLCPGVGSFPSRSEDTCFYVCYRARRSAGEQLRAIKVCCPENMFFDKKSHKCCDRKLQLKSSQKYLKKMYRRRCRKKIGN